MTAARAWRAGCCIRRATSIAQRCGLPEPPLWRPPAPSQGPAKAHLVLLHTTDRSWTAKEREPGPRSCKGGSLPALPAWQAGDPGRRPQNSRSSLACAINWHVARSEPIRRAGPSTKQVHCCSRLHNASQSDLWVSKRQLAVLSAALPQAGRHQTPHHAGWHSRARSACIHLRMHALTHGRALESLFGFEETVQTGTSVREGRLCVRSGSAKSVGKVSSGHGSSREASEAGQQSGGKTVLSGKKERTGDQ